MRLIDHSLRQVVFKCIGVSILLPFMLACGGHHEELRADYEVIPLPREIHLTEESPFRLSGSTRIVYPEGDQELGRIARFLSGYIREQASLSPQVTTKPGENRVSLEVEENKDQPEGYRIIIHEDEVRLIGNSGAGLFYACQTLRKSIPLGSGEILLPAGEVTDAPRFAYRGAHLDVGRHFFPVDFIKRYIDILAFHNLNVFHWHLTDDQGWRIEIRRYPKLTEIGSVREESITDGKPDGTPYGGYYTQEEIREVVAYAAERFVEVIPEIDLPGHTSAALAAYPELGCTGGPYKVPAEYGVHKDVLCVGNPRSIEFAKHVLEEVIDLFPSRYIHVGGDECPRDRWKVCPKCQALVREQGWKGNNGAPKEAQLQSYFMRAIDSLVMSKGRQVIGWDEIMEGGVDPGITVMAWRGFEKGIAAAAEGHDVVMTPSGTLYFSAANLLNLGGNRGIRRVYDFDPAPDSLAAEIRGHIIGSQACLWTERVLDGDRAEYLLLPRLAALSEVVWSDREKDFDAFLDRLYHLGFLYDHYGYNYSRHAYQITEKLMPDTVSGCLRVGLSTIGHRPIYYTLDGQMPDRAGARYERPIEIRSTTELRARVIQGADTSQLYTESVRVNKATFKPASLMYPPHENYRFQGVTTLLDGLRGDENYNTGRWLGFFGQDMVLTIDLKQETGISSVKVSTNVSKGAAVMGATGLKLFSSDDGINFRLIAEKKIPVLGKEDRDGLYEHTLEIPDVETRFVRVIAQVTPELPAWHTWANTPAFLFVDEVEIQ